MFTTFVAFLSGMGMSNKRTFYSIGFTLIAIATFLIMSCEKGNNASPDKLASFNQALQQKPDAQQLDSLYNKILLLPVDSNQVDVLISIYKKTIRKRPIRFDILDTALYISKKLKYNKGIAVAYDRMGINKRYDLKYFESVNYHKQALQYWSKTTDTLGKIKCLNSLGVSLRRINNEKEALNYYLEALKLSKAINHSRSIAISLNGIGNVFVNIKQYEKALPYFKKALAIETKSNNKKGMNYGLSNIGEVYVYTQQYDSALLYYNRALDIAKELDYKDNISINYNCLGYLFQQKAELEQSNKYYALAIPKLEDFNGKRYLSNTLINLGINYSLLGKPDLALTNISRGLNLAREINSPENIILAYGALSDYYEKTSSFQLALENYKNEISLRDSINSAESRQNIATLEASYKSEIKDKEIQNYQYQDSIQKSRNILQWIVIVFLIVLVSALIVFYRLKRKHNKLLIVQMRNDIQEYVQQIEKYEHKPDQEEEKITFYKNVEQYGLSEREVDVLLLISKGLKNDEIAAALFVSLSTVKTHTRNIFVKLDVRNRIEAARKTQVI